MKYLLKREVEKVIALLELSDNVPTPEGFEVITKENYDLAIALLAVDGFLTFNENTLVFSANKDLTSQISASQLRRGQRAQLLAWEQELELMANLEEDTIALQEAFTALKTAYLGT